MSSLPPQAIAEFQALWKKHCGLELPPDQAALRASEVFAVLRLVLEQPHPDAFPDSPSEAVCCAPQEHAAPESSRDAQENSTRKKSPEAASLP